MAGNLKKFVNPRFIKTIDLEYMKRLLSRHEGQFTGFSLDVFEQNEVDIREAIADLLAGSEDKYPEGLRSDLHRIAELGNAKGLEIIQSQAVRKAIDLFPDAKTGDDGAPDKRHDPKHLALRVFLEHPALFDVAADYLALMTADRVYEFAGRKRGVLVDLTIGKVEAFRNRLTELFKEAFQGDFCRIGDYVDGDEINFVISHGTLVSTMPIVEGRQEKVISLRGVSQAILRYSENTGILRLGKIRTAHQKEIAEAFASIVLGEPGLFAGDDAQHLYSLEVVEKEGASFAVDYRYDPVIDKVLVIEAAADLMVPSKDGYKKVARTLRSRDLSGKALAHFRETPVGFDGSWVLGEIVLRVFFKDEGTRKPQVTVKIRPPSVLQFRRTQHETRVMELIERNGMTLDHDDYDVIDAAE